jgi:hypothetical protein
VETALDLGVVFLSNESLKFFDWFGNLGKIVHGRRRFGKDTDCSSQIAKPA